MKGKGYRFDEDIAKTCRILSPQGEALGATAPVLIQKERDFYEAGREEANHLGGCRSETAGGTVRAYGKPERGLGIDKDATFGL